MNERILREVESEYQAQRAANRLEEQRRLEEAGEKDPQIKALVAYRQELFQQRMRTAFAAPEQAQEISRELTEQMRSIGERLRVRLRQTGLPEDYLQPVYACALCEDTGYVGAPVARMCTCMRSRVYALRTQTEDLGIQLEECFENWDDSIFDPSPTPETNQGQRAHMQRVKTICEAYADVFPETPQRNLFFSGTSGLGKTYALNCIAQRVLSRGYTVWKLTAHRLMVLLRDEAFGRGDVDQQRLLFQVPLLLIDDLGIEPMLENVTIPQLFRLLDERGTAQKHVIISTNLTPNELNKRYSERVSSRLMDARNTQAIHFVGKDVRRAGR